MRKDQVFAMIAANVFIVSLFPIALHNSDTHINQGKSFTGMDCFLVSLAALLHGDGALGGFGITNLAFFALLGMLLVSWPRFVKTRLGFSLFSCLYASIWFLNALRDLNMLGLGYYLWFGAYILLFFAHVSAAKKPKHFH
jgi:hypothetical protein